MARRGGGWRGFAPAGLAAALLGAGAFAQGSDSRNAAAWYARAVERLAAASITPEELDAIHRYDLQPGEPPPEAVRAALARLEPVFSAVRRGAREEVSDFELDYAQGFELTVPHLADLRTISKLMSKDALVRMHDNDGLAAAGDIAAVYRMSGHLADDGLTISSLVGQAIFQEADRVAGAGLDRGALGQDESARLLDALKQLPARDPFGVVGCIENEQDMIAGWVRVKYEDPADRAGMLDDFGANLGIEADLTGLLLLDDARFEAELRETDLLLDRVVDIFTMEDPEEARLELTKLEEEIERGDHGVLGPMLVPAYGKLFDRMTETQAMVEERSRQLAAIVSGAVTPQRLANAAVWYLQAIALLEKLDPVARAQLREVAADPGHSVPEPAVRTLDESAAIADALRRACALRRCDFSIAPDASVAVPGYPAGLRAAATLLHSDAVRLMERHEADSVVERLALCYAISSHLAGDARPASAIVSQAIFAETTALALHYVEAEMLGSTERSMLADAAASMGRRDPFGYVRARAETIRRLLEWVDRLSLEDLPKRQGRASIRRLDGDRLLYSLVVATSHVAGEQHALVAEGYAGAIDMAAVRQALEAAPGIMERITETGSLGALLDSAAPQIAPPGRRASAAADYDRAILALRPEPPPE